MKKRALKQLVQPRRWAAYAAAGAAAAGAGTAAEADIYYSGIINVDASDANLLDGMEQFTGIFTLQGGNNLILTAMHFQSSNVGLAAIGSRSFQVGTQLVPAAGNVAGFIGNGIFSYVSRLAYGQNVSALNFLTDPAFPDKTMAFGPGYDYSQFLNATTGRDFIGFQFDIGNGTQYGWLEVNMQGSPLNRWSIVSYAYADPGQSISAGQTAIPEAGSMGLLALGGLGLMMWRKRRESSAVA